MTAAMEMPTGLVERAAALVPMLKERAARVDADRRLDDDVVEAMVRAGLFRVWVPRRYGGHQSSISTHFKMITTLAHGCSSTAWTMAMMTTTSWLACHLPRKGQDEIFGADPDARFVGLFTPVERPAQRVDGGYLISGSRPWATGCLHATWAEIMVPVADEAGQIVNSMWCFVPMKDVQIQDTWHTMGMRGTGSHTITVQDLFVPDHRTINMMGPEGVMEGFSLNENIEEEIIYRTPLAMISRECFVGSCIGTAEAALAYVLSILPRRSISYGPHVEQVKAPSTQWQIAEIANMIDTARMHAERAAADCDAAAEAGRFPNNEIRARCGHDCTFAIRTAKEAVDRLMYVSGASAVAKGNPLERMYRDISTGTLHGIARVDATTEMLGSVLCGQGPAGTFVF